MKKIILLLAVFLILGSGVSLFAQGPRITNESNFYYFNFPIERVLAYRSGYVILYRNGSNDIVRTHIPLEWFIDTAGRGDLIFLGSGKEWPSMTVYYNEGEFSHVRLRLRREKSHETWGVIPLHVDLSEFFTDVEEVYLRF
ncbi:MAG: hypothetical protein FWH19_02660 [Treponema sp.]|nr:hypothetical protein [Treponema sp.]